MPGALDNTAAVILAGGFGTRIRHLAPDVPKPMIAACGRPFIEWVVRYLQQHGIHDIVLSTGHLAEVVERHFATQPVAGVRVKCVPETTPLGTAGGFLNAVERSALTPANWLVLNGDSLIFADLAAIAAPLAGKDVDGVVAGLEVPDAARYGSLEFDASNRLKRFAEKRPGAGVINAGVYLLRHELVKKFPSQRPLSFEQDVFPQLLTGGAHLQVATTRAPFLDIGTPESLAQAEEFIRSNLNRFETKAQAPLPAPSGTKPLLSVIIPFKNEAPTLPLVLDSLARQKTDFPFEVIFADGCSTDDSVKVIQAHPLNQKAAVRVIGLPPENHGMTVGRNAGARAAQGELFLFAQSDIRFHDPDALGKVVRALQQPGVAGTTFVQLGADKELGAYDFWGKVFQSRFVNSRDVDCADTKFNGVRRDAFEKIGGFDEVHFGYGGEDFDFKVRLLKVGKMVDVGVEVEHLHGYGKPFGPMGMLKKYCRNSECMGITVPVYWKHRELAPGFTKDLLLRFAACLACLATLVPPLWPWPWLALLTVGLWWNRSAFLHIRDWRLIWVPLYSLASLYCFTFYFLRGLITGRSMYVFDNRMK
jgi:D-glycero-alpha-D-manno-heptose 1-phosphate guanylyltransferase